MAKVDEVIAQKLRPAVHDERVQHLSVFAFGRLPLLVYLGAQLDDTFASPSTNAIERPSAGNGPRREDLEFDASALDAIGEATEGVLVLNVSGSIQRAEIAAELQGLPVFELGAVGITPEPDALQSKAALASFEQAVRRLSQS